MRPINPGDDRNWQGRYIQFLYRGPSKSKKTHIWDVRNGDIQLGEIKWFSRWRCYSFFPSTDTVFERTCLDEITFFVGMAPQLLLINDPELAKKISHLHELEIKN